MSDRRIGDRRTPDKGAIVIKFKDAIIYIVVAVILIISVSANIILARQNKQYRDYFEYEYLDDYDEYDDEYDDEDSENEDYITTEEE